jgi:hypothetical protein
VQLDGFGSEEAVIVAGRMQDHLVENADGVDVLGGDQVAVLETPLERLRATPGQAAGNATPEMEVVGVFRAD